jgi:hypothetical protein
MLTQMNYSNCFRKTSAEMVALCRNYQRNFSRFSFETGVAILSQAPGCIRVQPFDSVEKGNSFPGLLVREKPSILKADVQHWERWAGTEQFPQELRSFATLIDTSSMVGTDKMYDADAVRIPAINYSRLASLGDRNSLIYEANGLISSEQEVRLHGGNLTHMEKAKIVIEALAKKQYLALLATELEYKAKKEHKVIDPHRQAAAEMIHLQTAVRQPNQLTQEQKCMLVVSNMAAYLLLKDKAINLNVGDDLLKKAWEHMPEGNLLPLIEKIDRVKEQALAFVLDEAMRKEIEKKPQWERSAR